VPCQL
jgi:hypothetical protein